MNVTRKHAQNLYFQVQEYFPAAIRHFAWIIVTEFN